MPAPIVFNCPLPAAALRFHALAATQAVSALDSIEVTLLSEEPDIQPEKLLGQPAGVKMTLREGGEREFNGIVTRVGLGQTLQRHYQYRATLRPWLWLLSRTADCRIFQEQTVQQIVEQVFADHAAVAEFEFKLLKTYRKRSYCVQYRETDFNFVARLLEEEGIYWFFQHRNGSHKLLLVDDVSSLSPCPAADTLAYFENRGQRPPDTDHVTAWSFAREIRTGRTALASYDFERPSTSLGVTHEQARSHTLDDLEQFDFCGNYTQSGDGQHLVECQLEEHQSKFQRMVGMTNAAALCVGDLFTLERHPRADQNAQHLCLQSSVTVSLALDAGAAVDDYHCQFAAQPSDQPYRPQRHTPKPFVQGPQTAVVVGPAGEELFTDKYGRVKVQFHWDRYGKKDEQSSCWVRVSSPWAGKSFGFMQVPRIGQEVVVDFLEGDPDQPLITGRVYNAEQMPPWELPANATQSGVLSRSSKGGGYGNANALRFEDKKGAEQVWLHAEKNQDIEVENDETHWVGNDRSKTIDHDETVHVKHNRTETVDNNETITIGVDRTESVGNNETITIGANRSISVGANETATVALQRTHAVGANETIAVGGAQEITVGAAQVVAVGAMQQISVGASQSTDVGSNQSTEVGANRSIKVSGAQSTEVAKARSTQVGEDDALKVGKNLVIDAGDSVTIKTGDASITLRKDGTIVIKGKDISSKGSGKINVNASSDVVIKGSKVGIN